ncbi:MAG: C10 family peptidase [Bacteroidales bacterium]|nr:C10 family peptidase [Bacteroidales bacterium]
MNKRLLFSIFSVCSLTFLWAEEVSEQQALEWAQQFVSGQHTRRSAALGNTVVPAGQVSGLYVFNIGDDGGFVIVSNDDQTTPILGYGDSGSINPDSLPANMSEWLQGYAYQIAWLQANGTDPTDPAHRARRAGKAAVAPLVQTKWNQGAPYNNLCPEIGGERAVTGCVATTMAQLMYYHYAQNGFAAASTDIPGYTTSTMNQAMETVSLNVGGLDATTFSWADMTTTYGASSADDAKSAVARLMQYCGVSLQMEYGLSANGGSSAYSEAIPYALKTCFGYDGGVRHCYRKNYSYTDWVDLIYGELAASRPVAYGGQCSGGGHSFICDGYNYDDADYFHINWGWGGKNDGYFLLSVLDPYVHGYSGASVLDGFSFNQDAVIGIQKPADGTRDYCLSLEGLHLGGEDKYLTSKTYTRDSETEAFSGISLYYLVYNYFYGSRAFDVAVQLLDGSGKTVQTLDSVGNQTKTWNQTIGGTFSDFSIPDSVTEGTYYIKVMSRPYSATPVAWQECYDGDAYKLTVTISGNNLTVSVPIPANLKPASVEFSDVSGTGLTGSEHTFTASVTGGAGNYSGDLVLRVNGTPVVGLNVRIPAGETVSLSFSYIPWQVGNIELTLWTSRSGGSQVYGSKVFSISTLVIGNDEANTSLIQKNDQRTGNVRLAGRTLYKDGDWNTICLPFNLTLAGSVLDGAEARTLSTAGFSGGVLTLMFADPVTELVAGTPYIIRWAKAEGYDAANPATRDIVEPVFEGVNIVSGFNDFTSADGKVKFMGRYSAAYYKSVYQNVLMLGTGNKLYFPQPDLSDPENPKYPFIGACRAFFSLNDDTSVRAMSLSFEEESQSGLSQTEITEQADVCYDFSGRKIVTGTSSGRKLPKGFYVVNGRKVMIQ